MKKLDVIGDRTTSRTAIVVLGDASSAPSAVHELLTALGCDGAASQKHGHSSIAKLNDALLLSAGIATPAWAPFQDQWLRSRKADEFLDRAIKLLQTEFGGSYLIVMHAPSTPRLLPFWNLVFERSGLKPRYVNVLTDPLDDGLNGQDLSGEAQLAWLRDALDAERDSRGQPRVFVDSTDLANDPVAAIERLSKKLELVFPRNPPATFASRDPALKNFRDWARRIAAASDHARAEYPKTDWVEVTFSTLQRWSVDGEDVRGCKSLDAVRTAFDQAIPAFLQVGESGATRAYHQAAHRPEASDLAEFEPGGHRREEPLAFVPERTKPAKDLEAQLEARFSEIVTLTRLLAAERSAARKFEDAATRIAAIAIELQRGAGGRAKWFRAMMPWRSHLKAAERRLARENLFDSRAYLMANPDVARAGMNPLTHYLAHGAAEGRPLGTD